MKTKTVICGKEYKRRMRFVTWARKDENDETPIIYTFKTEDGVMRFTSENTVGFSMLERIRRAWIESIEHDGLCWIVNIYED